MKNMYKEEIYSEDLDINFNGYPLENVDLDELRDFILHNRCRRFPKNRRYVLKVIVEEVEAEAEEKFYVNEFWTCMKCGHLNNTVLCTKCGHIRGETK